jgi:Type II CAAX prenyl endopeptidase Rce1-like
VGVEHLAGANGSQRPTLMRPRIRSRAQDASGVPGAPGAIAWARWRRTGSGSPSSSASPKRPGAGGQLQRRHGALVATLAVAVLWAAWHAPMFAVLDSYRSLGVAALPGFFVGLTCGAVVLTWVYNTCRHSILAAAMWHGCYNLAAATQASQGAVAAVVTTAIMVWAVVLVVLEVRANRRGASILAAQHDPGRHGT